jgi:hypothetical protein
MTSVAKVVLKEKKRHGEVWQEQKYQELKAYLSNLPFRVLEDIYDQIEPEKVFKCGSQEIKLYYL